MFLLSCPLKVGYVFAGNGFSGNWQRAGQGECLFPILLRRLQRKVAWKRDAKTWSHQLERLAPHRKNKKLASSLHTDGARAYKLVMLKRRVARGKSIRDPYARLQVQLQLGYTMLHPAVVVEVTAAASPKPAFGSATHLSYSILHLKLPPTPCPVLLVHRT